MANGNLHYLLVSERLIKYRLPILIEKYNGMDARDAIVLYLYYRSHVIEDENHDLYDYAIPSVLKIAKDTGIDKNRLKRLNQILEDEYFIKVEKRNFEGNIINSYLPIY